MDFLQQYQKVKERSGGDDQNNKQQLPVASSSSSSPEFSFSVSLQNSEKSNTTPPSFTIDLSPADDIFFHGHLLPLHLLSSLPVPPRCSTNSIDSSVQLPVREQFHQSEINNAEPKKEVNCKPKSFSLLGLRLTTKWRKGLEDDRGEQETKVKVKRRLGFNLSNVLKRYARLVKPLLNFRGRGRDQNNLQIRRQSYSFSGNLSFRNVKEGSRGRRRGGFSAPVSMRTSPNNSGVDLLATAKFPAPSTNDSTMEELQAAIQAAIAHCKNSVLKED